MFEAQDFSSLLGISGFSNDLLNNHFKLYQGYVKNTNTLLEKFTSLDSASPEYKELKRRFGWEYNGMRLHELYFGNLSANPGKFQSDSDLAKTMAENFGSDEACGDDFEKTAGLRGIGWVVTYYDPISKKLFNVWIDEHAENHLSGANPLVVMDMWEHAFMIDYGLDKKGYIKSFMAGIDWDVVNQRFESAVK